MVSCTQGTRGAVAFLPTGNVTYSASANFVGADSFSCTIQDSAGVSSTAPVSVTVTNVNDAPVAIPDALVVSEDIAGTVRVLLNDTDPDLANPTPDTDTLSLVSCTQPAHGTRAVNTTTGVVTYTPAANYAGPAGAGR